MIWLIVVISSIASIIVVGKKASDRGQNVPLWCILAFFIGWIALIILLVTTPAPHSTYSGSSYKARYEAGKGMFSDNTTKSDKSAEAWICKKCGTKNAGSANYCSNCCGQKD